VNRPAALFLLVVAISIGHSPIGLAQDPAPVPKPTRIVLPDSILPYRLVRIGVTGDFDSAAIFVEPAIKADVEDGADGR
jgi:hypothetical protein